MASSRTVEWLLSVVAEDARYVRELLPPGAEPSGMDLGAFLRSLLLERDVESIFERFPKKWKSPMSHRHVFHALRKLLKHDEVCAAVGSDADAMLERVEPYCKLAFLKARVTPENAELRGEEEESDSDSDSGSDRESGASNHPRDLGGEAESKLRALERKYELVKSLLMGLLEGTMTPGAVACRLLVCDFRV